MEETEKNSQHNKIPYGWLLFLASFVIWWLAFKDFFLGKLLLTGDALPYYEHTKYYIDSLLRGVYPFWDPSREGGVPTEFFMRRLGSFNPLYIIIIILEFLGVKHVLAYFTFLAIYYFVGMLGFYCLSKRLFKDTFVSFAVFLILLFSSLTNLLFDSFLMLTYSPIVWFFYFLLAFQEKQCRLNFIGMLFTVMLILTTYVPFYFLSIFMGFCLLCVLFYVHEVFNLFGNTSRFVRKNKVFCCICVVILAVSALPGFFFFQEAKGGEIVMPVRHQDSTSENILEVGKQNYIKGGINTLNLKDELFSGYQNFKIGKFYIPIFIHILFLLGVILPINRRLALLSIWAFFFYLVGIYEATPIYGFLYEHIFFFKYMRNLQYFLWLVLLPSYILIGGEQFKRFCSIEIRDKTQKLWMKIFIVLIHVGGLVFLLTQKGLILTSWIAIFMSCFLFLKFRTKEQRCNVKKIILWILLACIAIQPFEVYHYLQNNAKPQTWRYAYDDDYEVFKLPTEVIDLKSLDDITRRQNNCTWYGVSWRHDLCNKLSENAKYAYRGWPLVVYDRITPIESRSMDFKVLSDSLVAQSNNAFVFLDGKKLEFATIDNVSVKADVITKNRSNFRLMKFDNNNLKFKITYNAPKFLVYNDSFYSQWHGFINGKEVPVYRTNYAFKGILLPAGKNIVHFQFGDSKKVLFNWAMMILYYGVFVYLIYLWRKREVPLD